MPGSAEGGPPQPAGRARRALLGAGLTAVVGAYLGACLFGIAAPFLWGHHGYHGATYMLRAIMTLRFHVVTPCNWAGYDYPPRFSWYFHHPILYHHLLWPWVWLLGPREWVGRGFAAAGGLLLLWAMYTLVRRHWSRELGLLAIAVVVTMPFVTQFAVLLDPMLPTMALTLVALDAFLSYWNRPDRRLLRRACAAFVGAGLLMWDGYFEAFLLGLFTLALLATGAGRALRLPGAGRAGGGNAWVAWTLWTGVASALTMAFHFAFTWAVGMMPDFRASYQQRHSAGFEHVYGKELEWAELLFGKPLLSLGVLWLVVFVARAAAGQARRRDLAVWLFLVEKTFYIYLFREAAAVHEYRVDWYLVFLTLAVVDLVDDLARLARFLLARWPRAATLGSGGVALAAGLAWLAVEAPAGYHKLIDSRERMGTDGVAYNSDHSRQLFAMKVAEKTGPEDFVFTLTPGFPRRIEFYFYMDRSNLDIYSLAQLPALRKQHPRALLILNPAMQSGSERAALVELLRRHPAEIYDGFMVVDLRSDRPGLREFEFVPQPTSRAYRFFVSHKYPPMKAEPRTSPTLECLSAEAEAPVPAGSPPPAPLAGPAPPLEQLLCRHNYLVLRGDLPGARSVEERLRRSARPLEATAAPGLTAVAARFDFRRGIDFWLRVDAPAEVPEGARLRLHLDPADPPDPADPLDRSKAAAPPGPGSVVFMDPNQRAAGLHRVPLDSELALSHPYRRLPAGWLAVERFPLVLRPGSYRARLDLRPSASSSPTPAAAHLAPLAAATTDLGVVEIR